MAENVSVVGIFSDCGQIKTHTFKEQAYKLIKEAILYQKFKSGVIYSQEAICQELGISRTPVREALLELQKEGYILFCRGKGIQIVSLDENSIHDILEMRLFQESTAAELAAKRVTEDDLAYISDCLEEHRKNLSSHDTVLCYRLDHRFHRALAKASKNKLIYHSIDDVLDHYLRFEMLSIYSVYSDANTIWEEHSAIFEAIKAHDVEGARASLQEHLLNAYRRTLKKYWPD